MPAAVAAVAPAPHPTITLLQTSSLSSVVQSELERMILSGELPPGEKLTEVALAARLGVSRGPLREAFRMLEEAGLVRTEKNRGVFVRRHPDRRSDRDLRPAGDDGRIRRPAPGRDHHAGGAEGSARPWSSRWSRRSRPRTRTATTCSTCTSTTALVELAGNAKLTAIYRKLIKELSLFRRLNLAEATLMPLSANEHRQIVKAIASGDAELAGRAMFEHVMESKERTLKNHPRDAGRRRRRPPEPAAPEERHDDRSQRPQLPAGPPAHRRRLRRRLRARLHRPGGARPASRRA